MLKTLFNILTILVFSWFAYVQMNDTDGSKWIVIYLMIAVLGLLSLIKQLKLTYVIFIFSFMLGYSIFNINLLTSWLEAGQPKFIDYEATNIEEVENIREFLGLILCVIFSGIYLFAGRKK